MRTFGLLAFIVAAWPLALFGADNQQPTEFKGTLRTGIMAIGGETTGTIIKVNGKTYELDLGNLRDLAEKLNGKEVVVQGTLVVKPGVEIKERRIITVTDLRPADTQQDVPAAPKTEADKASGEKRQLLANHETLAVFDGLNYRRCMGRTALCPDRCGHSGEFATFTIKKYLKYEKFGQYGDPEQKTFLVQVSDFNRKPKGDPKILETVKGLKQGDYVLLSWHHDYVTKEGASYPERPIVKLEAISKEKAEELMSVPVAKERKEETAKAPTPKATRTKTFMKGWRLHAWQQDGDTYYSLLPGTNRLQPEETVAKEAVKGIDAMKTKLDELQPGEDIFLHGKSFNSQPPKDLTSPVVEYGKKIGLKMQ